MYLITKRVTHYDNDEDCVKMYNHYILLKNKYDDDDNYIDYMKIVNDEGELIDECKRSEQSDYYIECNEG